MWPQGSARAEAAESDRPSPHDPSTGRDERSRVLGGRGGEAAARADQRRRRGVEGGGGGGADGRRCAPLSSAASEQSWFFPHGFKSSIHASCVGAGGDEAVDSTLQTLDSEQSQQPSEKLAALLAQLEVRPQSTTQQP